MIKKKPTKLEDQHKIKEANMRKKETSSRVRKQLRCLKKVTRAKDKAWKLRETVGLSWWKLTERVGLIISWR